MPSQGKKENKNILEIAVNLKRKYWRISQWDRQNVDHVSLFHNFVRTNVHNSNADYSDILPAKGCYCEPCINFPTKYRE